MKSAFFKAVYCAHHHHHGLATLGSQKQCEIRGNKIALITAAAAAK